MGTQHYGSVPPQRSREDDRHPLHWQTAAIAAGVWAVALALVALAWGLSR